MKKTITFILGLLAVGARAEITGIRTLPGGTSTYVQYNAGGNFGGDPDMTFNGTTITVTGLSVTSAAISGTTSLGAVSATSVTDSGLTSERFVLSGTGGLLGSDADFTQNGTTATLTGISGTNLAVSGLSALGAVTATSLTDSGLTSGRVATIGASGILQDDSDLTFSGTRLTVTDLTAGSVTDSGLTSGRVPVASSGGLLSDDSDFTFNGTTATITGASHTNLSVSGATSLGAMSATAITNSGLTSGRVATIGSGGLMQDDADFTFNGTTATITGISFSSGTFTGQIIANAAAISATELGYLDLSTGTIQTQLNAKEGSITSSLGGSGYIKFANGMYIQWMAANASAGGTASSWPIAFPTAVWGAVASPNNQVTGVQVGLTSTSQVTLTVGAGTPNCYVIGWGN